MAEGNIWQPVEPLTGWLSSDADAMRLQRVFRQVGERGSPSRGVLREPSRELLLRQRSPELRPQAADSLALKTLDQADRASGGGVAAMGASILRSYEEEQRLVQENATLRSQLEALRRQCENESDWRRDARSLQVPGAHVHRHRRKPSKTVSVR